jgi:hypothetical protein
MAKDYIKALPMTGINANTLGAFQLITNVAGLPEPAFFLKIINDSTVFVAVSYDGVTFNDYIPAHGILEIYAQAGRQPGNNRCLFKKGQQVWVGSNGAGVGSVNIVAYTNQV